MLGLPLLAFSAAVTTPAALGEPMEVSKQGPAAFMEVFSEQAVDTTFSHQLAWFDTADRGDTIPDVPDWAAFLYQFPELSEYIVQGGGVVGRRLGDTEDTVPHVSISPTASPSQISSQSSLTSWSVWHMASAHSTRQCWCRHRTLRTPP